MILPGALHMDFFRMLHEAAASSSVDLYVVGGFVRDLAAGGIAAAPDIDLVVEKGAEQVAAAVASVSEGVLRKFPAFMTYKVENPRRYPFIGEIDFATARTEVYARPGALPEVAPASIENDLRRRDFTVNAMAMRVDDLEELTEENLHSKIYDYFSGYDDLKRRLIRVIHDRSFLDDPTRLFRACRYAARIKGEIEEHTRILADEAVMGGAVGTVSWFRILMELRKGLSEENSHEVFLKFNDARLLDNLPFVAPQRAENLAKALLEVPVTATGGDSYLTMLRVIASFCDSERREMFFRAANLSRQTRDDILRDLSGR